MQTTESIIEHRKVKLGSDRSFGVVFAAVFVVIALIPLLSGRGPLWWSLIVAAAFAAVALVAPGLLAPLNRLWFRFGLLLHRILNPVVMGFIFFGAFLPMGLLVRLLGKDLLRLKRDASAETYWIVRDPPGPSAGSMKKQF
jgi:predicted membrane metal-binding protein